MSGSHAICWVTPTRRYPTYFYNITGTLDYDNFLRINSPPDFGYYAKFITQPAIRKVRGPLAARTRTLSLAFAPAPGLAIRPAGSLLPPSPFLVARYANGAGVERGQRDTQRRTRLRDEPCAR